MNQIKTIEDTRGKVIYQTKIFDTYIFQAYTDKTFAVFTYSGASYCVEGMQLGIEDHFEKPFSVDKWLKDNLDETLYSYLFLL